MNARKQTVVVFLVAAMAASNVMAAPALEAYYKPFTTALGNFGVAAQERLGSAAEQIKGAPVALKGLGSAGLERCGKAVSGASTYANESIQAGLSRCDLISTPLQQAFSTVRTFVRNNPEYVIGGVAAATFLAAITYSLYCESQKAKGGPKAGNN